MTQFTAAECRHLHDQCVAARIEIPPQSTHAPIPTIHDIKLCDDVRSTILLLNVLNRFSEGRRNGQRIP
jgi:hypothetical protein